MLFEELRVRQAEFIASIREINKVIEEAEKERRRFINKFSINSLENLPIDDYIVGKQNKDSFCYCLETKLRGLGNIKGGTPADKKFGLYYGKTKHDFNLMYRFLPKWGNDVNEAYGNIKKEIINLLINGENKRIENIIKNRLSPMFKGKILATYYPDKYLNIFSEEHINHFLDILPIERIPTNKIHIEFKKEILLDFRDNDNIMQKWSNTLYGCFLYAKFPPPSRNIDNKLQPFQEHIYPPLEKVQPVAIYKIEEKNNCSRNSDDKEKKVDYERQSRINKKLGERGERIVLKYEKDTLQKNKLERLIERIKQVSKENDSLGYDILSFNFNGNEKYIEVKSTLATPKDINFFLTHNEYLKAQELRENYYLYIVYEANTSNPKILMIKNPFIIQKENIEMNPMNYRVTISGMNELYDNGKL